MNTRKRKYHLQILIVVFFACTVIAQTDERFNPETTGDMFAFLPFILRMTAEPPHESHLKILCQVHLQSDQSYATVLSVKDDKPLIIAFSPHKLERPWSTITLRGVFVPAGESHPTDEGTMDWAYVFDRNGDGRIDFFSYLVGPIWMIPSANFDRGQLPVLKGGVTIDFFNANRDKLRNGFWHVADDNFDGTPDGITARTVDDKGWADGWIFVRDTDLDSEYDNCHATYIDVDGMPNECVNTEDGYRVAGKTFAGLTRIPLPQDSMLSNLNQVASACDLGAGRFYDRPMGADEVPVAKIAYTDACYSEMEYEACHSLALKGDARAQERLGIIYATAKGVEKDDAEAVKWFRLSAEKGYRVGLYNLGHMHFSGHGVPEDKEMAATLYEKAAKQNDTHALVALADMYQAGDGVEKDEEKAVNYNRRAAQMGHAGAQFSMGVRYLLGRGVKEDHVRAYAWWALASMHGSSRARDGIEDIAAIMSRKKVQQAKELALQIHERTIELREEQVQEDARILGTVDALPVSAEESQ